MSKFGFKDITLENWLEPDPTMQGFAKLTVNGPEQITAEDLLKDIFEPQLSDNVPREVKALFEVARGAMCYGYFFYPLYTLAYEQIFRVAETAVTLKCKALSAPRNLKRFAQKVDFLITKSAIPSEQKLRWEGIRGLRNGASHPEMQSIVLPGNALHQLYLMAEVINNLFDSP
jgi:hypothetical protein